MSLVNICPKFLLQVATLSPELPLGQPMLMLETVDRAGQSLPGELLPTESVLEDNILFEESIYDTISKTSDKVILHPGEGWVPPLFPTEKLSTEPPSSKEVVTLSILSSALIPSPTESTDSPFLTDLEKEAETKAAPTTAHPEQPSQLGFKPESLSGQGRS